jgi:hypothetical protein
MTSKDCQLEEKERKPYDKKPQKEQIIEKTVDFVYFSNVFLGGFKKKAYLYRRKTK